MISPHGSKELKVLLLEGKEKQEELLQAYTLYDEKTGELLSGELRAEKLKQRLGKNQKKNKQQGNIHQHDMNGGSGGRHGFMDLIAAQGLTHQRAGAQRKSHQGHEGQRVD